LPILSHTIEGCHVKNGRASVSWFLVFLHFFLVYKICWLPVLEELDVHFRSMPHVCNSYLLSTPFVRLLWDVFLQVTPTIPKLWLACAIWLPFGSAPKFWLAPAHPEHARVSWTTLWRPAQKTLAKILVMTIFWWGRARTNRPLV
jgi:hypothetical protein